jgi:hypothetical protein
VPVVPRERERQPDEAGAQPDEFSGQALESGEPDAGLPDETGVPLPDIMSLIGIMLRRGSGTSRTITLKLWPFPVGCRYSLLLLLAFAADGQTGIITTPEPLRARPRSTATATPHSLSPPDVGVAFSVTVTKYQRLAA